MVSRARPSRAGMYLHRKANEISCRVSRETRQRFPSRIVGGPCGNTLEECGCVRVAITARISFHTFIVLYSVRGCASL